MNKLSQEQMDAFCKDSVTCIRQAYSPEWGEKIDTLGVFLPLLLAAYFFWGAPMK
ncbi:hypothetical protein [Marinomonas posidonica]|uniref:Uncharacterized protein n=1 Tax=Marinomonas posidonica (strain CECT 7376 / NCIMB 14433 / IVIA-Po-181) TaxID=491952 RepID=F6D135_MARPP|nr:hypothetical protein [Marinomonas posidonica]AEF54842.1 hypothetical protein Mar181_1804 [Marinomonas posidonica IVIA-Po-181]